LPNGPARDGPDALVIGGAGGGAAGYALAFAAVVAFPFAAAAIIPSALERPLEPVGTIDPS
jgi:hypothetical protein